VQAGVPGAFTVLRTPISVTVLKVATISTVHASYVFV
jgi:hypothetical protein